MTAELPTSSARTHWPRPLLLVTAVIIAAFCTVPIVYLILRISESPSAAWEVISAQSTFVLAVRTVLLMVSVTTIGVAIALPLAWLTTHSDIPGRRILVVLTALPLAIPSYVGALVAISAFGPRGLLQELLLPLGVERLPSIYGFWGATIVLALFTYPYLLLTLRPAMTAIDPRLEELSQGFGHGPLNTFRRVILPQLRPALASGGLLVALYTLSDFGAVSLLRFDSLTRALFVHYESSLDRSGAAALAIVLSILALIVVTFEVRFRSRNRYDSVRGVQRRASPVPLGYWRWPALGFVLTIVTLALVLPVGVLGYWLMRGLAAGEAMSGLGDAILDSLVGSSLASGAAAVAAIPVALLGARYQALSLTRVVEVLSYSGYALPGLVVALALVFAGVNLGPLYQSIWLLIGAYVLLFLPQSVGATRIALQRIQPSMEEAARGLGRPPWQVMKTITAPLASRGIVAGAALVFLTTMKELPATLILAPIGFETLAVRTWSASSEAFFARAALPALVLISLSSLVLLLPARDR